MPEKKFQWMLPVAFSQILKKNYEKIADQKDALWPQIKHV